MSLGLGRRRGTRGYDFFVLFGPFGPISKLNCLLFEFFYVRGSLYNRSLLGRFQK